MRGDVTTVNKSDRWGGDASGQPEWASEAADGTAGTGEGPFLAGATPEPHLGGEIGRWVEGAPQGRDQLEPDPGPEEALRELAAPCSGSGPSWPAPSEARARSSCV